MKYIMLFVVLHFLGMAIYITVTDEMFCQGSYQDMVDNDCYEWKGAAGFWEVVLFQEMVVRPIIQEQSK